MAVRFRRPQQVLAGLLMTVLAACTQPAPVAAPIRAQPTVGSQRPATASTSTSLESSGAGGAANASQATPNAPPSSLLGLSTTPVQRGSITQTVQLNGHVTGEAEVPLAFSQRQTVVSVPVKPGDAISADQVLAEADSKDLVKQLQNARDRLETAKLRMQVSANQAEAQRQAAAATKRDALGVAQENLRQAQLNLKAVQAGASDEDRQVADAAVLNAQAAAQSAQAAYDRVQAGSSSIDLRTAQQAVSTASAALSQAQSDAAGVTSGAPDAVLLRTAERRLADAQAQLVTSQADLKRLTQGPNPNDLRSAQRDVERAQIQLNAAGNDSSGSRRDAAMALAKLGLEDANERLAQVKGPPSEEAMIVATTRLDDAKAEVANAQDQLAAIRRGPDQRAVDRATANVNAAKLAFDNAQERLRQVQSGPNDSDVEAASNALKAAQLTLSTAQARRDSIYGHPTPAELDEGQRRVKAAQAFVDRLSQSPPDSGSQDDPLQQRELQANQDEVSQLEADLAATRVRAPFDGYVVRVVVEPGQLLEAASPALIVTRQGSRGVEVAIATPVGGTAPNDLSALVAAGQSASVEVDGGDGRAFPASVAAIRDQATASGRILQLNVKWGDAQPQYGATTLVNIVVAEKQDTLVVPRSALQTSGDRNFVDYLDGTARKVAEVKVGAVNETQAEILSGLAEGQLVLARGVPQDRQFAAQVAGAQPTPTPQPNPAGPPTPLNITLATPQPAAP